MRLPNTSTGRGRQRQTEKHTTDDSSLSWSRQRPARLGIMPQSLPNRLSRHIFGAPQHPGQLHSCWSILGFQNILDLLKYLFLISSRWPHMRSGQQLTTKIKPYDVSELKGEITRPYSSSSRSESDETEGMHRRSKVGGLRKGTLRLRPRLNVRPPTYQRGFLK